MNGIQICDGTNTAGEGSVGMLAGLPAETKKIYKDVKRLLIEKLKPRVLSLSLNSKHGNCVLEKQHCVCA